jgi:hypothetical protein
MGTGTALPVALGVEKEKEHVPTSVTTSVKVKADVPMVDMDVDGIVVITDWPDSKVVAGTGNVMVVLSIVGTTFIAVAVAFEA